MIRLTVNLLDARMGMYVWAETYDMPAAESVLALQTGLATDLGSRLAEPSGVMARISAQPYPASMTTPKPANLQ